MQRTRGTTIAPILSGIAFVAAIAGGFAAGRQHPATHLNAVTTHGEWVAIPNAKGKLVRAYVAYPERSDKAPTLIIIHDIFGMGTWVASVADRYAGRGYVAIVPDLLSSEYKSTDSVGTRATQLISALPDSVLIPDLDAVYKYVNGLVASQKDNTGLIGFCWGGGTVWRYAAANPRIKAAVPCYGPVSDTSILHNVKAPAFAVYAENDARVTGMMPSIKAAMENAHNAFTYDIYKGVAHGFLKPGSNGYGTAEYDRALKNIDDFFTKQLDHK
jgi:carboxymethylenebutenolidase